MSSIDHQIDLIFISKVINSTKKFSSQLSLICFLLEILQILILMENPFFRNQWNYHPQPPRYAFSSMEVPMYWRTVPVAPEVVSIPVRFVESKKSRYASATKIQKVFRAFLVRKNVKKVLAIEREVNEIERTLANEDILESIRRDMKERVRFGEMLMSLLFRLDSVKGVDSGIRNFRKAVIKKTIALQEKVDSIATIDEATDVVDETPEADTAEFDSVAVDWSLDMNASATREKEILELEDGIPEHKNVSSTADIPNTCDGEIETANDCNELENVDGVESNDFPIEKGAKKEESTPSSSREPNIVPGISTVGDHLAELKVPEEGVEEENKRQREKDEQRREILERMMVENKKMMEMMEQLFERKEMQARVLCSLSHRVEQLEKAFVYETLRRKKKRSTVIVDSSGKCPKTKKCETIL